MVRSVPPFVPQDLHPIVGLDLRLDEESVEIKMHPTVIHLHPATQKQAHDLAFAFRRVARRFEEIGRGMPLAALGVDRYTSSVTASCGGE